MRRTRLEIRANPTLKNQRIVDAMFDEMDEDEDRQQRERAMAANQSPTDYALRKSVQQSERLADMQNRLRQKRGLSPLQQQQQQPDLQQQQDYYEPPLMYPPTVEPFQDQDPGILDESVDENFLDEPLIFAPTSNADQFDAIDAFETSLDRIMQYAKDAQELQPASDWSDTTFKHSDFFNRHIVGSITTSSEEPDVDLIFEPGTDAAVPSTSDGRMMGQRHILDEPNEVQADDDEDVDDFDQFMNEFEDDILNVIGEEDTRSPIRIQSIFPRTQEISSSTDSQLLELEEDFEFESAESLGGEDIIVIIFILILIKHN